MSLRPYQLEAVTAAQTWIKTSTDPCLIQAPTGSGKSHIIAEIAANLHRISGGKHILCLAPSAELVTQNREKHIATGNPASIFSASAGGTSLRHPVVFGTPTTVRNKIRRFCGKFCAVIVDEAHRLTPTIRSIIDHMREQNEYVRVIGLSATPYRLGEGYIFKMYEDGKPAESIEDAYFTSRVYYISEHYLIEQGYLTRPVIGQIGADHYDTIGLELNSRGQFDAADIDRAFHGHGRKTSRVVADVVAQSRDRQGVMLFAATVEHAEEVMASLPRGLSAIVTGKTSRDERARIIADFKARRIKYLVNVSVLTTGFDAPHVDVVALLRATESVALLQQIIGRGLRIDPAGEKQDCLVLDYAENLERHCPDGDIFSPEVSVKYKSADESPPVSAKCPQCGTPNEFAARKNPDGFKIDEQGYFLDLAGTRIQTEHGHMPAHYGRRCQGLYRMGATHAQCDYRWTFKECPHCGADNDIAARRCVDCRGELVDPNEKLRIEFKAFKRDPTRVQTDEVLEWEQAKTMSRKGNECIRVTYTTPYRQVTHWLVPGAKGGKPLVAFERWADATEGGRVMPSTITYRKNPDNKLYEVYCYGEPADALP